MRPAGPPPRVVVDETRPTASLASLSVRAQRSCAIPPPSAGLRAVYTQEPRRDGGYARACGEQERRGRERGYVGPRRGLCRPTRRGGTLMKMRTLALLLLAAAGLAALPAACGVKVAEKATPAATATQAARPLGRALRVALPSPAVARRRLTVALGRTAAHADAVGGGRRREAGGRDRRGQGDPPRVRRAGRGHLHAQPGARRGRGGGRRRRRRLRALLRRPRGGQAGEGRQGHGVPARLRLQGLHRDDAGRARHASARSAGTTRWRSTGPASRCGTPG